MAIVLVFIVLAQLQALDGLQMNPSSRLGGKSCGIKATVTTPEETRISGGKAILDAFKKSREAGKSALVGYLTCGYPKLEETAPLMVAMEKGGADIIELGVPFTDPMADGATIQQCNEMALEQGVGLNDCIKTVHNARELGLEAPVVLMGYYNPFRAYGFENLAQDCANAGIDGFIIVDLPPEEAQLEGVLDACRNFGLGFVPLVAPTTTNERLSYLAQAAQSTGGGMLYCVSVLGVTGAAAATRAELEPFLERCQAQANGVPLAVGFGISKPEHVSELASLGADGIVVGSAIIRALDLEATAHERSQALTTFTQTLTQAATFNDDTTKPSPSNNKNNNILQTPAAISDMPDHFGDFGGRYIPETLAAAHAELEQEYAKARADPSFAEELDFYRRQFIGGPTPLYYAERLTEQIGGAQIWLKREELAHTGAHKINNAIGQALLAKRLGKTRIIAETGAGQHGVATATVCALLGLDCIVYMGAVDCARQSLNVFRMNVLGAQVIPVRSGQATLKDAINEAMRDWVTNVKDTHYLIGSAIGPHPFPTIVRDFQSVIGREAKEQFLKANNKLPDAVVACVGGGSNAVGMFHDFIPESSVELHGAEADGDSVQGSATLSRGSPGVLHGTRTYLLQNDQTGQVQATHSISAGLDYPGVGPEHAFLKDSGRAKYHPINNEEALDAFSRLSRTEGIIPALEPSHAVALAIKIAKSMNDPNKSVLINLCGRGDKDMITVAKALQVNLDNYTPTDGKWESFTDRIGKTKHS
mmetsp:Transcript_6595/g.9239  ORF Transcript_6595/g.9239 Transcript_6595/m.9239 type:complete len:762 (+) Transcript_6595:21-2306(+)